MIFDYVNNPVFSASLILFLISIRLLLSYNRRVEAKKTSFFTEDGDGDGGCADVIAMPLDNDLPADVDMIFAGPSAKSAPRGGKSIIIDFLDAAAIAIALVFLLIKPFVIEPFFIPSNSMYPTLQENDRVLVTKYNFDFRTPHHGEIVIFHAPRLALELNNNKYDPAKPVEFVKRVIGLPGDHIQIINGKGVFIDGVQLKEKYLHNVTMDYTFPPSPYEDTSYLSPTEQRAMGQILKDVQNSEYIVPSDHVFVLGDNRSVSLDSHRWGSVPIFDVIGKPICRLFWSLNPIRIIPAD